MPTIDIPTNQSARDWQRNYPSLSQILFATTNNANHDDGASTYSHAFMKFDTSPVFSKIIASVDLHLYSHAYTKSAPATYQYEVSCCDQNPESVDDPTGAKFFVETTNQGTGWLTLPFGSSAIANINLFSDSLTYCKVSVANPGSGRFRNWAIRTYEYAPVQTYRPFLRIVYSDGPQHQVIFC